MNRLLKLAASGASSGLAERRPAPFSINGGPAIVSPDDRGNSPAVPNTGADQPVRQDFKRTVKPRSNRRPNMARSQLAALAVSAMVAIPAYDYVSTTFDSTMVGLIAVSLLLIPLLGVMRCLLDPCVQ